MEAQAFAPGHITSFFVPHADPSRPPVRRGSRGSGFCIASGVTATGRAEGRRRPAPTGSARLPFELIVKDNGTRVKRPEATTAALRELVRRASRGALVPPKLTLENRYSLPPGAGFGVSGACALTAALVANEAMRLGLDRSDCVAAAHVGEVEALSGLGDVGPQAQGGFEIRTREGPPPYGEVLSFEFAPAEVLLVSFGPRHTRAFLSDPAGKDRLEATGTNCLERLLEAPTLERCVRLGRNFAETLGLVSPSAGRLMQRIDPTGLASVAMLGDSVFALGPAALEPLARRYAPGAFVELTSVSAEGARLL